MQHFVDHFIPKQLAAAREPLQVAKTLDLGIRRPVGVDRKSL